jgi:signal transduction histidine kinase
MNAPYSSAEILPNAFPGISETEAAELIASSKLVNYPAGTILCRENKLEEIFYILISGDVSVKKVINKSETRMLKTLHAGDFFGEMALIHNAPRAASVTAITDVTVLELHKDEFDRVLQRSSSISMAMVREISNRLRENDAMAIEDLRMRANELARAYEKLAEQDFARREFLTNISYELRTPLTAAGGYLQLLQKGIVPAENLKSTIETIQRNVQQITSLVNDILFVQEMDLILPKFQSVDSESILHNIVQKYIELANTKNIEIHYVPVPGLSPISGDAKSLERALTAIVDNAIKFSPNGGIIDVSIKQEDSQIVIVIEDHGIGIEPDRLATIFDRYTRIDKIDNQLFSGLGIGLAITKQVIEQHHGKLEVESVPGKGTKFSVRLNIMRVAL